MALEQDGIPTVAVHTNVFARLCKRDGALHGHAAPASGVRAAAGGRSFGRPTCAPTSTATIRCRSGPFMQEVIDGLTRAARRKRTCRVCRSSGPRRGCSKPDTEDSLQRLFEENHWTDCLPVMLPTEARVEAMLKGTSHPPDKVVGRLRPTAFREFWEFTVEKVAVNAVMAGARPAVFPGDSRARRERHHGAIEQHQFVRDDGGHQRPDSQRDRHELGHRRRWVRTTTPTRRSGAPTACSRRISRADRFRARPTWGRSATGTRTRRSCPRPKSAVRGSRCTCSRASSRPTASPPSSSAGGIRTAGYGPQRHLAGEDAAHASRRSSSYSPPLLVMDPIAARGFVELGFDTKEKLIDWCAENGLLTAREYWDNQWTQYSDAAARSRRRRAVRVAAQAPSPTR